MAMMKFTNSRGTNPISVSEWPQMQMAHKYFTDFLTKGEGNIAEEIFDSECIHVDQVWAATHPTVDVEGMKHYVADLKSAFPDFWVEIKEISTCDTNSIWVWYEGAATGLGDYHGHRASHHSSIFSGINIFKFNADRSKIVEMHVYRSAFAEDKQELVEKVPEGGFRELRLRRLV